MIAHAFEVLVAALAFAGLALTMTISAIIATFATRLVPGLVPAAALAAGLVTFATATFTTATALTFGLFGLGRRVYRFGRVESFECVRQVHRRGGDDLHVDGLRRRS